MEGNYKKDAMKGITKKCYEVNYNKKLGRELQKF